MEFRDYYQTLGAARDAPAEAIKKAYRRLARKYHPDVSKERNAERRMKEVNEDYAVLSDPEKRAAYDHLGRGYQPGQDFRRPARRVAASCACAACVVEQDWVVRRVEEGLFPASGRAVAEWRFSGVALARARRMREIERDFDAVPELAALAADLLEEMDELRARLRRAGLD